MWTAVKFLLLPICMILYIFYQLLLLYVPGGPFAFIHKQITTYTTYMWEHYFIHLVHHCFSILSRIMLYLTPTILPVIFMVLTCILKPPYWTYFEMPLQENLRLLLYPRQLMILSCIQLNSMMKWQFSWEWLFYKGYHPFQRVATNGSFLLSILFNRIQQILASTVNKISAKTKNKLMCKKPKLYQPTLD